MESKEFLAYINNPVSLDAQSLKQLEELQKDYPFFQSAQLLYALNLFEVEHPHYPVQLKRASVYAIDRRQLKRHIDRYRLSQPRFTATPKQEIPVKPTPSPKPLKPVSPIPQTSLPADPPASLTPRTSPPPLSPHYTSRIGFKPVIPGNEEQQGEETLREKLLEIVHQRLKEIAEEHGENWEAGDQYRSEEGDRKNQKERYNASPPDLPNKQRVKFSVESSEPMSKSELIEKFIREEPRISSPRKVFLKPTQPASRDLQEEEEIVSETLAILYYKQGNTAKSIHIYEKLCLLFPEKSSYFAARIKELKADQQPGY